MSNRLAASTVKCTLCGAGYGQCDCWATCEKCGFSYERSLSACDKPVHRFDAEVEAALKGGYWTIDPYTHRLYKSHARDVKVIYTKLSECNLWFSRRQFNDDLREGVRLRDQEVAGKATSKENA